MGNTSCSPEYLAHLTSLARDVCPFPNYSPNPLFVNMLSPNSSLHLRKHYMEVQSSLTPKQLEDFTQGLRRTFGKEGKVTLGGVGVVALSLAVLFDMLGKQAKGECLSDSGPIPGLFIKNQRGYYPPHVYTVSEYLRLVPHIANNPTRMREETERYVEQLKLDDQSFGELGKNRTNRPPLEDTTAWNVITGQFFWADLNLHLLRINNGTTDVIERINAGHGPSDPLMNFNCNLETFDKEFLAALQQSDNDTQEAFKICKDGDGTRESWLEYILLLDMFNIAALLRNDISAKSIIAQREDFDLKANALGKWDK